MSARQGVRPVISSLALFAAGFVAMPFLMTGLLRLNPWSWPLEASFLVALTIPLMAWRSYRPLAVGSLCSLAVWYAFLVFVWWDFGEGLNLID